MAHEVAVGAAEEAAFAGTEFELVVARVRIDETFATLCSGGWWASCFAGGPPRIRLLTPPERTQTSTARSRLGGFEVRIADGQRTLATLAHELAHVLAGVERSHDGLFRGAYVDTATAIGGVAVGEWLADAFTGFGLDRHERRWPPPWTATGAGFVVR